MPLGVGWWCCQVLLMDVSRPHSTKTMWTSVVRTWKVLLVPWHEHNTPRLLPLERWQDFSASLTPRLTWLQHVGIRLRKLVSNNEITLSPSLIGYWYRYRRLLGRSIFVDYFLPKSCITIFIVATIAPIEWKSMRYDPLRPGFSSAISRFQITVEDDDIDLLYS